MNTIKIPHYIYREGGRLGIFKSRLADGDNLIICTKKLVNGKQEFPKGVIINKQKAIEDYGLCKIQEKSNEDGI